jgi:hypothetical protein
MEKYLNQLFEDIARARKRSRLLEKNAFFTVDFSPFERSYTPEKVKTIEAWTGIRQEALPPAHILTMEQLNQLRRRLLWMLAAYSCQLEFEHTEVPEYIQYQVLRAGWKQKAPLGQAFLYHFEYCDEQSPPGKCLLGEYCECVYWEDEDKHPFDRLWKSFEEE